MRFWYVNIIAAFVGGVGFVGAGAALSVSSDGSEAQDNPPARAEGGERGGNDASVDLAFLRARASAGDAAAQAELAMLYLRGKGVRKNFVEGYRWLEVAGERGSDEAKFKAALLRVAGLNRVTEETGFQQSIVDKECPEQYIKRKTFGGYLKDEASEWPELYEYFFVRIEKRERLNKIDYLKTFLNKKESEKSIAMCVKPQRYILDYYIRDLNQNELYGEGQESAVPPYELIASKYRGICKNNFTQKFFDPWAGEYLSIDRNGNFIGMTSYIFVGVDSSQVIQDKSGKSFLLSNAYGEPGNRKTEKILDSAGNWRGAYMEVGGFLYRDHGNYEDHIVYRRELHGYECTYRSAPDFEF